MKIKNSKLPLVIILVGFVLSVVLYLVTGVKLAPTVKEAEFELTVNYTLDGEAKTYVSKYTCRFDGHGDILEPRARFYAGEYADYCEILCGGSYTVAQKDGYRLAIVTSFNDVYLMGDTENEYYDTVMQDPYFAVYEPDGSVYTDPQLLAMFDAQITSWEHPEPIENSLVFGGFSMIYETSMFLSVLAGILTVIACLVLVKKTVESYAALDIIGVVLNFLLAFLALPFMTLAVWLITAFTVAPDAYYQIHLCVPAVTLFTLAASISYRRLGRSKLGFFIQFAGPVMFIILMAIEVVITYAA